jgi:hypothetical protein
MMMKMICSTNLANWMVVADADAENRVKREESHAKREENRVEKEREVAVEDVAVKLFSNI